MRELESQFEGRKRDHIAFALKRENEAIGQAGFERVELTHDALPDIDFSEVSIEARSFGGKAATPFLVSSMTGGHAASLELNLRLALAAERRGWWMGVGSQRRELHDSESRREWKFIRQKAPKAVLLGNLGIAQLIVTGISTVQELVDNLEARAMIIHLNALQECLQPEGTPQFKGGLQKIAELVKSLSVPVVVKETGCGISAGTARRLFEAGVQAIDVSGFGGTHWGRIEGARAAGESIHHAAAQTFANWGISTVDSLRAVLEMRPSVRGCQAEVWASGGVRNGLDAAKLAALGAVKIGFAKPILEAAIENDETLDRRMEVIEYEFKTALFCSGSRNIDDLRAKGAHLK